MNVPANLKYTASHEWARREEDGTVTVGITDHAQGLLGDMVYVESPEIGRTVSRGEECAVVESVKAASDVYAPISGEIVAINEELDGSPEKINEDAYSAWMFRIQPSDPAELESLLDASSYENAVENEAH
ncbi:MAG: glycine cleavage system protein GcvH [Burkholderiales bacterium]|nr:glycine cleavage system protein GcvH [Burkholderiales bacterium]